MLSLRPLSAAFPASPASAWVRAPRGPRLGRYWRGTWSWGHRDVSLMNRRLGRHHGGHRPTHLPRRPSSAQDETTHDSSGDAGRRRGGLGACSAVGWDSPSFSKHFWLKFAFISE